MRFKSPQLVGRTFVFWLNHQYDMEVQPGIGKRATINAKFHKKAFTL